MSDIRISCNVCGVDMGADDVEAPQMELLIQQFTTAHNHPPQIVENWYMYMLHESFQRMKLWDQTGNEEDN